MFKCEKCDHDFEKEGNFNFHKDALHKNTFYFNAVRDIESKFRCKICETKFETEKELKEHKTAVWCKGCLTVWNCKVKMSNMSYKASKVKEASVEKEHNV